MRLPRPIAAVLVASLLLALLPALAVGVRPAAAGAFPTPVLTVEGGTGPIDVTDGMTLDYRLTGLLVAGQGGVTFAQFSVALFVQIQPGPLFPEKTLVASTPITSATMSGQVTIDLDGLTSVPGTTRTLYVGAGASYVAGASPVSRSSNLVEVVPPPPAPLAFTTALTVNGQSGGSVALTPGVPVPYAIAITVQSAPDDVTGYSSALVLTRDPDSVGSFRSNPDATRHFPLTDADGLTDAGTVAVPQGAIDLLGLLQPPGPLSLVAVGIATRFPANETTRVSAPVLVEVVANAAPTITGLPARLTTAEDTPASVSVTVADDTTGASALTVTTTDPALGTVVVTGAGATRTLTYTPDPNANGTDTFEVRVSDGTLSTTVTVPVTITAVNDAPVIDDGSVPAPPAVEATGPGGAVVSFAQPAATDVDGTTPTVTCAPAGGGTFPLGTTTVTCTASDGETPPLSDAATFPVTVTDTTAPVITSIPDLTVPATSTYGAVVSYALPVATDVVDTSVSVACAPASGGQFSIGTTPVSCTATDDAGNASTASFLVTVTPNGYREPRDPRPGASAPTAPPPTPTPRPTRPARPSR